MLKAHGSWVFFIWGVFIKQHSDMLSNYNIRFFTERDIQDILNISISKIDKDVFSY